MFLQEKVREINKALKVLGSISNIVIWGAGRHTCKLFEWTDIGIYNIESIVDINEQKHGNPYFGFIIQGPKKVSWSDVGAVVISVPGQEKSITEMLLKELGFSGCIVTLYQNKEHTPFYLLYDENVPTTRFFGDYDNWNDAYDDCDGYDDSNILSTVSNAIDKVIKGEAVWERDGCLFYKQKYVYRICAAILKCALQNENKGVRILDIGGSLGSTYFQNKKYLADVKNLEYVVAEQDNFADYGHQKLEDEVLKFIRSTDNWDRFGRFDIILLSGSFPWISQYKEIVSKILRAQPHYIIFDRTVVSERTRICREIVSEEIYKGSYPLRIFSERQIEAFFEPDYKIVERDSSSVPADLYFVDDVVHSKYFVFEFQKEE